MMASMLQQVLSLWLNATLALAVKHLPVKIEYLDVLTDNTSEHVFA